MIDVFKTLERLMAMDDRAWLRHANPWSGWTRVTVLPLLALAIWSRVWIGLWAVPCIGLILIWTWVNPRLFPPPRTHAAWMTRGVLGERVFLEHRSEIAAEHVHMAKVLSWLSLPGVVLMIWGLWALWWEAAAFGMVLALLPKFWFIDRMVWIHGDWVAAGRAVPGFDDMTGGPNG